MQKITLYSALCFFAVGSLVFNFGRAYWHPYYSQIKGKRSVDDVMDKYEKPASERLLKYFQQAGVAYPPEKISLIAIKDQNILELWAHTGNQSTRIKTYPVLAASGKLGPKLREGDRQVPEGIYKIESFNPNSAYHLSMKLNYPNPFDLKYAKQEERDQPGSDIFIHGKTVSIGCLAMGDPAIEELFTLAYRLKTGGIIVIISPTDPALGKLIPPVGSAEWVGELYQNIEREIGVVRGEF